MCWLKSATCTHFGASTSMQLYSMRVRLAGVYVVGVASGSSGVMCRIWVYYAGLYLFSLSQVGILLTVEVAGW